MHNTAYNNLFGMCASKTAVNTDYKKTHKNIVKYTSMHRRHDDQSGVLGEIRYNVETLRKDTEMALESISECLKSQKKSGGGGGGGGGGEHAPRPP